MRPLTLRLEGLRSYRSVQTVDFTGRAMVAIVGDTGAGKSSLLEAITFALYGAATWTKQAGDLIGDRSDTMKVELTFRADGSDWQITRTMSTGTRASVHRLTNLESGERIDGARELTRVVERLVGLDYEGFLRTVLLPQGKFAQLLEANPAERQRILRNVFRVDELDQVRARAKELRQRLGPRLDTLRFARGELAADPRAAAADAATQAEAADVRVKELDAATTEVTLAERAADDVRREIEGLQRLADAVDLTASADAASRVRAVATADTGLAAAVADAARALADADEARRAADDILRAATAAGDTEPALQAARAALDALPMLVADIGAQLDARRESDEQAAEADVQERAAAAAQADLTPAEQELDALDHGIMQARARLDRWRGLVDRVAEADRHVEQAEGELVAARTREADAQAAATPAVAEAEAGRQRSVVADDALAASHRADAAAHAASGIAAGDPCPVCERTLPDGFTPPSVPALTAAEQATVAARDQAATLATAAARAEANHEAAVAALAATRDAVDGRHLDAATARASLAAEAGLEAIPQGPGDATALLAGPAAAVTELEQQRTAHARSIAGISAQVVEATTRATALQERVDRARTANARGVASSRSRLRQALTALAPLPSWQPDLPDLDAVLDAADPAEPPPPPELAAPAVDVSDAVARIDQRLAEIATLSATVATRTQRRDDARTALEQAKQARQKAANVTTDAYRALDTLALRVDDAAGRVGAEPTDHPPPHRAEPDGLADGAAWADTLLDRARAVVGLVGEATGAQRAAMTDHQQRAAAVLTTAGASDAAALATLHATAIASSTTARDEQRRAAAQVAVADDLDGRIGAAAEFLDAVSLVYDQLANTAFIGEVLRRRHAELLGVAARILSEVTGGRYGFSPEFAIVDLHTGQERATKTLSGGESFLASLALALAMVEIASRAGGRLDALFLDEGFGSLDATSLDAAIDALESRAEAGRLVAVISHVPGVAERIEDVLDVRATTTGSIATWQSPAEREAAFTTAVTALL